MISASEGGAPRAVVIEFHPKLVDKWARRYIHIYSKEGAVYAKRWATAFLPEAARTVMSIRAKEILNTNKKGPDKGPGS